MAIQIQPIRQSTHSQLNWKSPNGYAFARELQVSPIAAFEVTAASVEFPLGIIMEPRPTLVAVLGLPGQDNLFVGKDGRWLGSHVPALFRSYPFKLIAADQNQYALGVDHGSGLISQGPGEGQAFFDVDTKPTPELEKILQGLMGLHRSLQQVDAAIDKLQALELLEPWSIKIRSTDDEKALAGLYKVNENKLVSLDDTAFLTLRAGGALAIAYAQLISMSNLPRLSRLAQFQSMQSAQEHRQREDSAALFADAAQEAEIDWDAVLKSQ